MFPRLRFKKFDGDWEKTTIGAKSETVTSGSRDWAQYYSDSGDKFIRMTNLVRNGINLDLSDLRFVQLPVGSNEGKRTSLEKGDILISITAELGKLGWIPEGLGTAYINQHTALVRMKNTLDSKFVAYALSTEKYNNKLNSLNDSGAKAGLNLGSIRSFELTIPSKPEQTQIASFLSVVDEKISQLTQKFELLSKYKQGMMQKLFSHQVRFKADDGSDFGAWEDKKLGEISKTFSGGTPQSSNKSFYEGTIPFIKSGEISKNTTEQCINDLALEKSSAKLVKKGDLLYALYGATSGQVAISQIDGAINQAVLCIRSEMNTKYLLNFLLLKKEEILTTYLQGGQGNLSASILKEIYIPTPCLQEQTKIANFLSAIDQKIEVVAQQIEQAKTWKKGLLQQMFI